MLFIQFSYLLSQLLATLAQVKAKVGAEVCSIIRGSTEHRANNCGSQIVVPNAFGRCLNIFDIQREPRYCSIAIEFWKPDQINENVWEYIASAPGVVNNLI